MVLLKDIQVIVWSNKYLLGNGLPANITQQSPIFLIEYMKSMVEKI